jgi:riboflavin kinase/FMN adenylyltransferase
MQVIRGLHNLNARHRYCVATIGNFDGVHLGHQQVFRQLTEKAATLAMPSTAVIFEPQPMEYFASDRAPSRLTRLGEKLQVIRESGINRTLVIKFTRELAQMSAEDFIHRLLIEGLDIRYLLVGDDFRFGKDRAGNFDLLKENGEKYGFEVHSMNSFLVDGERVSSTRIRRHLERGEMKAAARLLGRDYRICGRVAHGDKRGRTIGFPTLNIDLHRRVSPLHGVFAVRVHGIEDQALPGVANIGTRPTVRGDLRYLLEVHLFDFDRTIYGQRLQVEFCKHLREEKRFDTFELLRQQIERDSQQARDHFNLDPV